MIYLCSLLYVLLAAALAAAQPSTSNEELARRVESHLPRPTTKADIERYLRQKDAEFQANGGRSYSTDEFMARLSAAVGINLGRGWIQRPRLKNGRWDFRGEIQTKHNYIQTDSGVFCEQGYTIDEYTCYQPDGSKLGSVDLSRRGPTFGIRGF